MEKFTLEDKLQAGYIQIAAFVYEHCQKFGCIPGKGCFGLCCSEIACNIARSESKTMRGATLDPPNGDGMYLKDKRCTLEPWLRPICSIHACDRLQLFAGDQFWKKYTRLREKLDRLEYERRVRNGTVGADAPESEDQVREDGRPRR